MIYRSPRYRTHRAAPRYSKKRLLSRTASLPAAISATPLDTGRLASAIGGVNAFEISGDDYG